MEPQRQDIQNLTVAIRQLAKATNQLSSVVATVSLMLTEKEQSTYIPGMAGYEAWAKAQKEQKEE